MLSFKLKRMYHKIFRKKALEKVDPTIVKNSCNYWKYDIFARYTPFHSAQDVFEYLKEEEKKKNSKTHYFCGGGCGGGCIGGCGGGCI
ncbi:MAG: hypothetical protein E7311_01005 [Clostridiales bacterium]|nr:hypothetical protein [Clostridiales bacterium]